MHRKKSGDLILLRLSVISYFLMSASILLMPVDEMKKLAGGLFWGGLLLGSGFQFLLESHRRAFFAGYHLNYRKMQKRRCGFWNFFSNRTALFVDVLLAAGFLSAVTMLILTKGHGYLCFVLVALTVFCICLHCIVNGRNYFHVKNITRVRRALEHKKESEGVGKNE